MRCLWRRIAVVGCLLALGGCTRASGGGAAPAAPAKKAAPAVATAKKAAHPATARKAAPPAPAKPAHPAVKVAQAAPPKPAAAAKPAPAAPPKPAAAAPATGTITGTVTVSPAKDLRNTFVYLVHVPGHYKPVTKLMNQKNLKFVPHLLAIAKGDTVRFRNIDHVTHNVMSPDHESYNLGNFGFDQSRTYTFHHTGGYTQLCVIHPEMLAYVFVGQNPYDTGVGPHGHYTLRNVPAGTFKIALWNPDLKAKPEPVTVKGGQTVTVNLSLGR